MSVSTNIKSLINKALSGFNLQLDSLTAQNQENERLLKLQQKNHFSKPVFPLPTSIKKADPAIILNALSNYVDRFESFKKPETNEVGYTFSNEYYSSPDTEVLYAMVRLYQPAKVVEIGCGNSTRITRQAIIDSGGETKLLSIDPCPRIDIANFSDQIIKLPVEETDIIDIVGTLKENDILFIDSSHFIGTGTDTTFLLLNIIPHLPSGAIIHIHDIFLPFEYPVDWVIDHQYGFNEQYVMQAMLYFSDKFEVIWPGYYLQKTMEDFNHYFPNRKQGKAQSLWIKVK